MSGDPSKRQRLLPQALGPVRTAEAVGRAILQISELKGDVEARLAASERKMEAQNLAAQSTLYALVRESAARATAYEEKLAAAEARIAVAEQLAERRLKASDTTIASLQAELRAVREMATETRQAAFVKPSREQVLVLLRQKADFSGLDLSALDLSSVHFGDAKLVGTNFEDADLSRADLRGANLQHAKFAGANLTGADMRDSQLQGAVGLEEAAGCADLRGATHSFGGPKARPVRKTALLWRYGRSSD